VQVKSRDDLTLAGVYAQNPVSGIFREHRAINRHNLFCESEANQFAFSLQNRTTVSASSDDQ
jgi:hypothetical protein